MDHRYFVRGLHTLLLLVGCGHSGTQSASASNPPVAAAPTLVPSAVNSAISPTDAGQDIRPNPNQNSAVDANPTNTSRVEERLPSGVLVDQSGVGGPAPGPDLPKATTVLHIGDSFAGALGIELNKVLEQAGVHSVLRFETSTYIPTWAFDKKLEQYLAQYKPDLVLISLGANELQNPEPEKRIPLIHHLIGRLGNRSCAWVAPVLWEGADKRLLEVIRANVAPCVFLDSNSFILHMPRARDKIHPSMDARPDWARIVARWLAYHRKPNADSPWNLVEASATK
jgi:lysophospholipase L1-like esterase